MGNINMGRVILGGIVAGIVGDLLGYLVDGMLLGDRWAFGMQQLGKGAFSGAQMAEFEIIGIVGGILTIWLYAAVRPRFGAGPKTAVYVALVVWAIGTLLPNTAFMYVPGLFPRGLTAYTTAAAIVETIIATLAGAALYQEATTTSGVSKAAAA